MIITMTMTKTFMKIMMVIIIIIIITTTTTTITAFTINSANPIEQPGLFVMMMKLSIPCQHPGLKNYNIYIYIYI